MAALVGSAGAPHCRATGGEIDFVTKSTLTKKGKYGI